MASLFDRLRRGRKGVQGLMIGFCLILGIPWLGLAKTLRVPEDYPTIPRAAQAAQAGDTIQVGPGEYGGVVALKDGVTLLGAGETTRLREAIKLVHVRNVTVRSLSLQGVDQDSHFGFYCVNAEVVIQDVQIRNFHHGISAESSKLRIENCKVTNGFNVGILLTQHTEAVVEGCSVLSSTVGVIVSATEASVVLTRNRIAENSTGVECYDAYPVLRENTITQNFVGLKIDHAQPDLGTIEQPGNNRLIANRELAIQYEGKQPLIAQMNWWGASTGPAAEQIIGKVIAIPWLLQDPQTAFAVRPVPSLRSACWAWFRRNTPHLSLLARLNEGAAAPRHDPFRR